MRFFLIFSLCLTTILTLTSCRQPTKLSQKNLIVATGSKSGVYYAVGEIIARILKEKFTDIQIQVLETEGSFQNIALLQEGKANLALVQNDVAHQAYHGELAFQGKKITCINGLATCFPEAIHIICRAESGIASLSSLAGKKVAVGPGNSGTFFNAQQILTKAKVWELIKPQMLAPTEAFKLFEENQVDALFFSSGIPNSAIQELATRVPISFIPIEPDLVLEMVNASPSYYFPSEIPEGIYAGIATAVPTLEINALLISHNSLNENDTYLITKTLFGSLPKLRETHPVLRNLTANSLRRQMTIPLSPGAQKALSE